MADLIVFFALVTSSTIWVCFFLYSLKKSPEYISESELKGYEIGVVIAIIGIFVIAFINIAATVIAALALFK